MKIFGGLRAGAVLGIALTIGAARAEKVATMPAPTGYVDDYAGVLSAPAKAELEGLCREVHEKTKAQVFFVTVKTLDGEAMEPFANDLFHTWKIGEKKTDRGILLILAIVEHQRRIEVGYGLEGILPDAKVGDIGRNMVPALKASNYDEAARIGVRAVSAVIAADSGVTLAGLGETGPASAAVTENVVPPIPEGIGKSSSGSRWPLILFPIIFFGGFGLFVALVVWNIRKGTGSGGSGGFFGSGGGGFGGSDGGSSFGGDGGGSSDSGGGFSGGDGGDSGGGGAGGSW